jgi:hypothetical protein
MWTSVPQILHREKLRTNKAFGYPGSLVPALFWRTSEINN